MRDFTWVLPYIPSVLYIVENRGMVAQLLCGSPVVIESMGNRPVTFKRLSEELSPPLKAGYRDTYSTSVEMESLSELNEDNKWEKTYTQCSIRAKRCTCWRFKPQVVVLFCCFIVFVLAVIAGIPVLYKRANGKIIQIDVSNQDVQNNVSDINNTKDLVILEKIASLEHNIFQLTSELDAIRDSTIRQSTSATQGDAALSDRLSRLEKQLTTLSNQMHNPVNLYKNCKEDTVFCTIDPDSHTDYWRDCRTKYLPLHEEVHIHAYGYSAYLAFL